MKMNSLKAAAAFGLTVLLANTAAAQNSAASSPVGYYTETLQTGFNVIGVNLFNAALASGTLTGVDGAVVTDSSADFVSLLNDDQATYFLETPAGVVAEIDSVAAGGEITLVGAAGLAVGDIYTIRAGMTLEQIFGDTLTQGATDATADVVFVPTGEAGNFDRFFRSSVGGGEFRNANDAFVSLDKPVAILSTDALLVERKDAAPVDVVVAGAVKTDASVVNLPQGFYPVTVSGVVGSTLQNSGLADNLQAGTTDATADVVFVPGEMPGTFSRFFVSTIDDSFRDAGSAFTALTEDVPLGSAVLVERKGADTTAVFEVPSFYSSL